MVHPAALHPVLRSVPPPRRKRNIDGSLCKSLSLSEFDADPHWKQHRQPRLSPQAQRELEHQWDHRHSVHFSRHNHKLNPLVRDYFDRGRLDHRTDTIHGPQVRCRPSWSLKHDDTTELDITTGSIWHPPAFGGTSSSTQFLKASQSSTIVDGSSRHIAKHTWNVPPLRAAPSISKGFEERWKPTHSLEDSWNDRHAKTHSAGNFAFHDNHREYFTRYLQPRRQRVVQQPKHGLTMHHFHRANPAHPDGLDDEMHPSEYLLTDSEMLAVPPVPGKGILLPMSHSAPATISGGPSKQSWLDSSTDSMANTK